MFPKISFISFLFVFITCNLQNIVLPGIDGDLSILYDQKVGLITNPTGVTLEFKSTIDVLFHHPRVKLTALFGMVCSE